MTTEQIIKDGLRFGKNEDDFRKWASQWFPGIVIDYAIDDPADWVPLEVWAFRAREMAGDKWRAATDMVHNEIEYGDMGWSSGCVWLGQEATTYQWILIGCVALEMKKEK